MRHVCGVRNTVLASGLQIAHLQLRACDKEIGDEINYLISKEFNYQHEDHLAVVKDHQVNEVDSSGQREKE